MATKTVFMGGFVCSIISFFLNIIAFASPYWIESWHRLSRREFEKAGLWEFCFDGYTHPDDYYSKIYVGCWWVYSPEYYNLREWLMPTWFLAVQWLSVAILVVLIFAVVIECVVYMKLFRHVMEGMEGMFMILCSGAMFFAGLLEALVALIFGVMSGERSWLPRPDWNFPSWSFAFAIISGIFAFIAGVFLMTGARRAIDNELLKRRPPPAMRGMANPVKVSY